MEIGENRECFCPQEMSNIPKRKENQLKMFQFVGRLFGLAIRSSHCLNLSLAPCIWKRLLGEPITVRDISTVDIRTGKVLKACVLPF